RGGALSRPGVALWTGLRKPASEDEDDDPIISGTDDGWLLGKNKRHKGSIHRDSWFGPARTLADRGGVCVYPGAGWVKKSKDSELIGEKMHYSLIMLIITQNEDIDLLTEARALVPVDKLVARVATVSAG
ncbi:MAG: hypothetical protein WCJ64_04395, partial [Rhodospirillaceae bacterium]